MLEPVVVPGLVLVFAEIPAAPVVGLMALGLVMAIFGHTAKDNRVAGTGIGVLFLATLAMVVLAFVSYQGGGDLDPRPKDDKLPNQVYQEP